MKSSLSGVKTAILTHVNILLRPQSPKAMAPCGAITVFLIAICYFSVNVQIPEISPCVYIIHRRRAIIKN